MDAIFFPERSDTDSDQLFNQDYQSHFFFFNFQSLLQPTAVTLFHPREGERNLRNNVEFTVQR
jgi:hypothetical protein